MFFRICILLEVIAAVGSMLSGEWDRSSAFFGAAILIYLLTKDSEEDNK